MMNCGVDIIEISRIREAVEKNEGFLEKVFSTSEILYYNEKGCRAETLAGFYAAKEAFSKYRKTGIRGFKLTEVSVEHEEAGMPYIAFRGERQKVSLSISHNKTCAVAIVCGVDGMALAQSKEMRKLIPQRAEDANKGDCGHIFIVGGALGMTGAAVLSARGALRSGAGLVTVGTAASQRVIVASRIDEAMTLELEEKSGLISSEAMKKILKFAKKADAMVFGPGFGRGNDTPEVLGGILQEYTGDLVIDADGLYALSKSPDMLRKRECRVVITPHPGEMARLARKTVDEVQRDRERIALGFAKEYGVVVVLKGHKTVIAEPSGEIRINPTGNCGMATGGTGDVLSGVIASFMGQGLEPFSAAVLGAYIHGKAGDIAMIDKGIHGLLAGDVADAIPEAIKSELL